MSIENISGKIKGIQNLKPQLQETNGVEGSSFAEMFKNALQEVNSLQHQADNQIEGLVLKKDGFTPHSAMMALDKADVAFQLMGAVRSKIIKAYEEVMRTQV